MKKRVKRPFPPKIISIRKNQLKITVKKLTQTSKNVQNTLVHRSVKPFRGRAKRREFPAWY